jgi:DNA-binding SARP family transcriptional activator
MVDYGVLGPLTVVRDGQPFTVRSATARRLLALLLCQAGEPVDLADLVEAFGFRGRAAAGRKNVQVYVHRLRQLLGEERITHSPAGYRLVVSPGEIDALRFVELVERGRAARAAEQLDRARQALRQALALWRGEPYADVIAGPLVEAEAERLSEVKVQAHEDCLAVELDLGRHQEVIAELAALSGAHPYREQLRGHLMLSLYRSGRQAEALQVYRDARTQLVKHLGIEPGPVLQRLHEAILRGDESLQLAPSGARPQYATSRPASPVTGPAEVDAPPAASSSDGRAPTPSQLPSDVPGFTGRDDQLKALDDLLDSSAGAVVVSAIGGTGGVGKTALAVHWAHRVIGRFPDGQLFVNLRGFDGDEAALDPSDVQRGFLHALGISDERQPADAHALTGLYRTALADRRILLVLDNARDADQVRPLLPGGPGCLVVVTSRRRLTSLVATDGAQAFAVDTLLPDQARELLARRLGPARLAAEPQAVEDIVAGCGGLPLALVIIAARAAVEPGQSLALLADELNDQRRRLDALRAGDAASSVSSVLSWSYRRLDPGPARLLRLLGLHSGPDISAQAAAGLAGVDPTAAGLMLAELADCHLVIQHDTGRFGLHDLVRDHLRALAHATEPPASTSAALARLLDHYLHTAHRADRLLYPHRKPLVLADPLPGVIPEPLADKAAAAAWFSVERPVLLDAVYAAVEAGLHRPAAQLVWIFGVFLDYRGHWHESVRLYRLALVAARRLGDPALVALAHRGLGIPLTRLGELNIARRHLEAGVRLSRQVEDVDGLGHSHLNLARVLHRQGRLTEVVQNAHAAHAAFVRSGNTIGQAWALNLLGWCLAQSGDLPGSLANCHAALARFERAANKAGQSDAWYAIGYAHSHGHDHHRAAGCFQRAADLASETGKRYDEATYRVHLGDSQLATGQTQAARAAWRRALVILDDLGHPDAEAVREKLDKDRGC